MQELHTIHGSSMPTLVLPWHSDVARL